MFKSLVLAVAWLPFAVQASNLPDYPFIHTSGEGFAMIVPDMGEIDFDLTAFNADPAQAASLLAERAAQVQALMVEGESSATLRDTRKELRAAEGDYAIRSSVHIAVQNLANWRPLMQALLALPGVDHLSTTFARKDREQLERELTVNAVKDAQRRADAMAAGFGKKVGAVSAVSSGQLRNLTGAVGLMPGDLYYRTNRTVDAAPADKDFLAIEVLRWSQTVDVIFRIK
ncbi:MAG TPA: SIMPL domain-containing protein [Duganella sp.]|nr:SIMPL domain-containing protein [Duganella sp.]